MSRFSSVIRFFPPAILLLLSLALPTGCYSLRSQADVYSATATASINPALAPDQARREAINRAETQARDQILIQAAQFRTADGKTIEDLAVVDPFIRAMLQDTVRNAQVADRTVSPEGLVTVTLRMEKSAVNRMVENYHK